MEPCEGLRGTSWLGCVRRGSRGDLEGTAPTRHTPQTRHTYGERPVHGAHPHPGVGDVGRARAPHLPGLMATT